MHVSIFIVTPPRSINGPHQDNCVKCRRVICPQYIIVTCPVNINSPPQPHLQPRLHHCYSRGYNLWYSHSDDLRLTLMLNPINMPSFLLSSLPSYEIKSLEGWLYQCATSSIIADAQKRIWYQASNDRHVNKSL